MPQIRVSTGEGEDRIVELGDRPVSFGRAEDNDVVLTEQKASRKHCTVRPIRRGWRVVDEQSSNGTWLGGKPVLSARLQSGDEVEIGLTVLTFVAQPGELAMPEVVRPRRQRTIHVPWEAPLLALLVAAGAWFGADAMASEQTAREASAWKRVAQADVSRAALAKDESAWRQVLSDSAGRLSEELRAGDAAQIVKGAVDAGMPHPAAVVADEQKPEWSLALERIEAGSARMSASERRSRLHELLARWSADAQAVAAVAGVVRADVASARDREAAEVARLLADADAAVAEGTFSRAIDDWTAWLAAAPDASREREREVATKMAAARGEAKLAAGVALALYEEQMKEGRVTGAGAVADAAMARLRGTGWEAWLAARTRRSDGSGAGPTPTAGPAAGPRESDAEREKEQAKERRDRALGSADALARSLRFADAAAALAEIAAAETDAGLKADLTARAEDLRAEAETLAALLAAARADASKIGVVPLLPSGTGRITGADEKTFLVGDAKGDNPHPVPLSDLPSAAYVRILDHVPLQPASYVGAALLCRELGEPAGYSAWMRKALDDDAIRMAASAVHARTLGAVMPAAGYASHPTDKTSIVTFDERRAIENAVAIAARTADLAKVVDKIGVTKQAKQVQTVAVAYAKLEAARKHALELIFDEVKYFYPYLNRQKEYWPVQKEVDARVALVKEAWEDGVHVKVRTDSALEKLLKQADDLRIEITILGGDPAALVERAEQMRSYLGKDLTVQSFFETQSDLTLLEYNKALMDANAKVREGVAEPEREQVRITNEYRCMMGHRRVLRLHEKLVASARGHSEDMSKLGFFDHINEQNPAKRTPGDRMLLAGYTNTPCSENIHMGSGDPQGAHNGWVHSSGHHRNILDPRWSEMGTGVSAKYWTQNFGYCGGDEQVGGGGPK